MYVTIRLNGQAAVRGRIQSKIAALTAKVGDSIQVAGIDCQAGAKQDCPVDTGRLRASITYVKINPLSCRVGTNVKYAVWVERGHVSGKNGAHVPAHPFLIPNYLKTKKALLAELKALVS